MLGLPFVVQHDQLHNSPGWLFHLHIISSLVWKKSAIFAVVNDNKVATHKQTISRQACARKKEPPLLQLELSISLFAHTV